MRILEKVEKGEKQSIPVPWPYCNPDIPDAGLYKCLHPLFSSGKPSLYGGSGCSVQCAGRLLSLRSVKMPQSYFRAGKKAPALQTESASLTAVTAMYFSMSALNTCVLICKTYLSDISYSEYTELQGSLSLIREEERDLVSSAVLRISCPSTGILPCRHGFQWMR